MRVGIYLPVYNEEATIVQALKKIESAVLRYTAHTFILFVYDDGSTDRTLSLLEETIPKLNIPVELHRNEMNKGLVVTTKQAFDRIVPQVDFIVKLDADRDFDQEEAIEILIVHTSPMLIALGEKEMSATEKLHADKVKRILHEHDLEMFDPSFCGTYCVSSQLLKELMQEDVYLNYAEEWGLDMLLVLLIVKKNYKPVFVELKKCNRDLSRRSEEKIKKQYALYEQNIKNVFGE